jgi:site-specific DNA-methyltransferase (adenine-specific)
MPAPTTSTAVRLLEGDCLDVLADMRESCFDAIVTDPPWNLGKDYGPHDDAISRSAHVAWLGEVLAGCRRVSRGPVVFLPGAHLLDCVPALLTRAGLAHAATLTWRKPAREPIVWAGAPRPASSVPRVIWAHELPLGDPARDEHPCPKPLALMRTLVEAATPAGGSVLDPFAGSGTTLLAATACGRTAVGVELDRRYAAFTRRRLRCLASRS